MHQVGTELFEPETHSSGCRGTMKALIFVTQFYQLSGAEKLAVELAKGLTSRGHEVTLLSMYSRALPGAKEAEGRLTKQGIQSIDYEIQPKHV